MQLSPLSLSHSYIITLSIIVALSSLISLQFIEDPPLPQQFNLFNELPIFTLHKVDNLGLATDCIHPEIPLVSQTPEQMSRFHLLIRYAYGLYEIKPYSASWFPAPCSEKNVQPVHLQSVPSVNKG